MTWLRITVRRALGGAGLPAAVALATTVAVTVVALAALSGRALLDAAVADSLRTAPPAAAVAEITATSQDGAAAAQDEAVHGALAAAGAAPAVGCACPALEVHRQFVSRPLAVGRGRGPQLVAWVTPELPGRARLVAGRWPSARSPGGGPLQAALQEGAATATGLRVGSTVLLPGQGSAEVPVLVVGLWRPLDPGDRFWAGGALELNGVQQATTAGPLLLPGGPGGPPTELDAERQVRWRLWPSTQVRHRVDLLPLSRTLDDLPTRLSGAPRLADATVSGGLAELLSDERARLARSSVAIDVLLFLDLMLAGVLIALTAALAAQSRSAESRLLRARGASPGQRLRLALAENVLPAAAAAPLSAAATVAAVSRTVPDGPAAGVVAATAAGFALGAGLALGLLVHAGRDGVRAPGSLLAPGVAGAAAVAVLAGWQLEQAGPAPEADPVLVAAPALLLLGAAVAAVRLLRPVSRWGAALGRRPGVVPALVGWSLARR